MKCPGCNEIVLTSRDTCPNCNCDLVIFQEITELRTTIRIARTNSENVASQIRVLEERLASLEPLVASRFAHATRVTEAPEVEEIPRMVAPPPVVNLPAAPTFEKPPAPPTAAPTWRRSADVLSRESELHFGQKWLLIIGIAITVLAVGYFLKYSFDRNWINPESRVGLAYLAGFLTLGLGEFLRRRGMAVFGLYLIGGSIAVFYFAGYAGYQIYQLIEQPVAFGMLVVVTCAAGALSLIYDTKWLAVLGIIGGFLTPVVLSTGVDNQVALMTYMAILNAGILAIAMFKQWQLLNYLGLAFTWLLFTAWYLKYYIEPKFWVTTVYLNIFFLAYAFVPFVYYFVRSAPQRVAGFALTLPNAFIAFAYSFVMISAGYGVESVAIVTTSYALMYFVMAAYLRARRRENTSAFVLLLAMGVLFLVVTVPIYFSRHWITVFWAVQGIVLLWAALRLRDATLRGGAALLLFGAVVKLLAYDYPVVFEFRLAEFTFQGGYSALLVERWLALAVAIASLFVGARMLKASGFDGGSVGENAAGLFDVLFGVVLFLVLNVEVAAYFKEAAPRAQLASVSVLWAVFAAVLIALGFLRNVSGLRRVAIGLFAATVIKVFVRDMADVDTPFRILSFLVVGLLLVAASFLYHRFASRILKLPDEKVAGT